MESKIFAILNINIENNTIMHYIDTLSEFSQRINENENNKLSRKTGNILAHMLGRDETAGREIFKVINENVDKLERMIEEYNVKHQVSLKKSPLEVKIDKAKLDMKYLISMTKLKKTPFISDVIIANILNYKILIRPIKNAKIISLAYRYYLAMIRHCLQSSLVIIELSSDIFFSQINANLVGRRKQMKEMMDNIMETARKNTMEFLSGQSFFDENGKEISIKNIVDNKQLEKMTKLIKQMNTLNNSRNEYDRISGYNQNVFQDSGRTIESMLKANQDKELQSISEQFTAVANATSNKANDSGSTPREHVSNYAMMVKLSTERRAMEVCSQINMNMLEIVKMFSIRNIDGFSEVFEESNVLDKKKEEYDKELEKCLEKETSIEYEIETRSEQKIKEITKQVKDEEKEKQLEFWKAKGFEELCKPDELKKIIYENDDINKVLKNAGFNESQIYEILQSNGKIQYYDKLYYGDLKDYLKTNNQEEISINKKIVTFDEIKSEDDDKIYCWMRKNSPKYRQIKESISQNKEE